MKHIYILHCFKSVAAIRMDSMTGKALGLNVLLTRLKVYQHYLHMNELKIGNREWKQNLPVKEKVKCVTKDIATLWDMAGIPHNLMGKKGDKRVLYLVMKFKEINKVNLKKGQHGTQVQK